MQQYEHQINMTKQITQFFLNCNFSKEQSTLREDDRMLEICRSVLSVYSHYRPGEAQRVPGS